MSKLNNKKDLLSKANKKKICMDKADINSKNDPVFFEKILRLNQDEIINIGDNLKKDVVFFKKIANISTSFIKYADKLLLNNESLLAHYFCLNKNIITLFEIKEFKNKDIILKSIEKQPEIVKYISDENKKSKEIFELAIKSREGLIKYADKSLRNNKDFIMEIIQKGPTHLYEFLDDEMKSDKDIAMESVKHYGWLLSKAPDEIKQDRNIVIEAIKSFSYSFSTVQNFWNDPVLVQIAKNKGYDIDDWSNKDFVIKQVKLKHNYIEYVKNEFKNDKDVIIAMLKGKGYLINTIVNSNNRELIPDWIIEKSKELKSNDIEFIYKQTDLENSLNNNVKKSSNKTFKI